jgi:hypothetical protein
MGFSKGYKEMNKGLKSALSLAGSGKKLPVEQLVRQSPETAAVISKLIQSSQARAYDRSGNRAIDVPVHNDFHTKSREILEKHEDAESILQLFPDMKLSEQILVSSIISPKDMGNGEVSLTVPESLIFGEAASFLLEELKSYFAKDYKIDQLLPKMLRRVLFRSGSYPVVVIPESSLDEYINGEQKISMESLSEYLTPKGEFRNLGILGDPTKTAARNVLSAESFNVQQTSADHDTQVHFKTAEESIEKISLVHVYDNPFVLKMPELIKRRRSEAVTDTINKISNIKRFGVEAFTRRVGASDRGTPNVMNDSSMSSLVYKGRKTDMVNFSRIKTNDQTNRKNVGAPLVMVLPSESVMPVYTPGHEDRHVGYFLMVDSEGYPVTKNSQFDHFGDLGTRLSSVNKSMSSYMLDKVKESFDPNATSLTDPRLASRLYGDIIEADLLARLRNGIVGGNVQIGKTEDIYRTMFARALANQRTNLVYIPAELMTYFANRYDESGIGKSLMDDMRVLNSLRAMTMFSRVMASIKNSIGRTNVALKLDENDPNPQKAIEMAVHEVSRTRQQYFPLGLNTPSDLVDWLQRSGYEFTFSGHPGLPDMSLEFSEKNSNYVKPDDQLDEELKKRAIQAFGLPPEVVDKGFEGEFATSIVANNILLTKQVTQLQADFVPQLTAHARMVAMSDGGLIERMKKLVIQNAEKLKQAAPKDIVPQAILNDEDSFARFVVSEVLSNFETNLPQPDSVTLENQVTAFETFEKAVDAALKYIVSEDIFSDNLGGEASKMAGDAQNAIKSYLMREWMQQNNFMPELLSAISGTDDKKTQALIEAQSSHVGGIVKFVTKLLNQTRPVADAAGKDIKKITDGAELGEGSSAMSSGGGGGGSSGGGFDSFGGGSDFDMGGDLPSMDTGLGGSEDESSDEEPNSNDDNLPDLGGLG